MNSKVSIFKICFWAFLMCGCNLCFAQTSDVEIAKELIKQAREAYDADNNSLARKLYEQACDTLDYEEGGAITTASIKRAQEKLKIERACLYMLAMIDSDYVRIRVADTGCGISPEDLPRIKEKFYKANFSTKGSGIGLAVCDEIINLHKGTLDISSVYGEGTEVNITLPTLPVNLSERKDN